MGFLNFYQHLPENIDPIAFSIGDFGIRWYALMYLAAFLVAYLLLRYRVKKREGDFNLEQIERFLLYAFFGLLIGARLGYVLFYNFSFYIQYPLAAISPFNASGKLVGIYGMSYFGGLAGILVAGHIFCKKHEINFWKMADFAVPAIPAGYFFGRVGNFLNGELFGRVTDRPWGMYFSSGDNFLRHPSQLYEAFFEGLILFVLLWALRNRSNVKGQTLIVYLFSYGFFRFFIEFFREPDLQSKLVFDALTLGQFLSLLVIISAAYFFIKKAKNGF